VIVPFAGIARIADAGLLTLEKPQAGIDAVVGETFATYSYRAVSRGLSHHMPMGYSTVSSTGTVSNG
jgi:hypothetical protein